jgi:coenzyme PQQ precursor peptide PqqA
MVSALVMVVARRKAVPYERTFSLFGYRPRACTYRLQESNMSWTKPEFEVVEVTMEVTAYVARR